MESTRQFSHWPHRHMEHDQQQYTFQDQSHHQHQIAGDPPQLLLDINSCTQPRPSLSSSSPASWYQSSASSYNKDHRHHHHSPGENAVQTLQFQDEMAETMFATNPVGMTQFVRPASDDFHNHGDDVNTMAPYFNKKDRKQSFASSKPTSAEEPSWVHQSMWEQGNTRIKQTSALPIRNAFAFRPYYTLCSPESFGAPSDTSGPLTPVSPEIVGVSTASNFENHPWINARPQDYSQHSFSSAGFPKSDIREWSHVEYHGGIGGPMLGDYPLPPQSAYEHSISQQYQSAFPVDCKSEGRLDTPELEGYASSVDARSNGWRPRTRRNSTRVSKDEILVEGRRRGMSYREIKLAYNFTEAESTLRGRYRTLTKEKKDRVRKPEWTNNDLRLLCDAVRGCFESSKIRALRTTEDVDRLAVPWKEVSSYIARHDGTYNFGFATCKKKFVELLQKGRLNESPRETSLHFERYSHPN